MRSEFPQNLIDLNERLALEVLLYVQQKHKSANINALRCFMFVNIKPVSCVSMAQFTILMLRGGVK